MVRSGAVIPVSELPESVQRKVRALGISSVGSGSPLLGVKGRGPVKADESLAQQAVMLWCEYPSRAATWEAVKGIPAKVREGIVECLAAIEEHGKWSASVERDRLADLFSVPNESRRSKRQGAILKAQGMKRGTPDLFLDSGRGGYFGLRLELKVRPNRLTKDQRARLERLWGAGYYAVEVSGESAVDLAVKTVDVLRWYVGLKSTMPSVPMLGRPVHPYHQVVEVVPT